MTDILAAAASDPGRAREVNEDRVLCHPERGIFAVIDGVGGHAAGEVAADVAHGRLLRALSSTVADPASRIREAITLANNSIHQRAAGDPKLHDMACVVTVALLTDGHLTAGHVGDTRLYKVHRGTIRLITRDHSPVGEREAAGSLTELEAMQHPRRNEIYRDVGTEPHDTEDDEFIDVYQERFEDDCALVLSSDGLSDLVLSARIRELVERHAGDPEATVRELIAEANSAGGKDNVSVVVIEGKGFAAAARARAAARERPAAGTPAAGTPAAGTPAAGTRSFAASASSPSPWPRLRSWLLGLLALASLAALAFSLLQIWQLRQQLAEHAAPSVLRVAPGDPAAYSSIAAALDAARPGQIVELAPGEYGERIRLRPGVAILSPPPGAVLRLDPAAGSTDPLIAISASGVRGAQVSGLRILGDDVDRPLRVGVNLVDSEVVLENMEISGASVAAIDIAGNDRSLVRFNQLVGNAVGVRVGQGAAPRLVQNLIVGQRRFGLDLAPGAAPRVVDNRFADNGTAAIVGSSPDPRYLAWNTFGQTPAAARFLERQRPEEPPAE